MTLMTETEFLAWVAENSYDDGDDGDLIDQCLAVLTSGADTLIVMPHDDAPYLATARLDLAGATTYQVFDWQECDDLNDEITDYFQELMTARFPYQLDVKESS